jgi:hypothetical protein
MNIYKLKPFCAVAILALAMGCTDLEVDETDSRYIESESGEFTGVDPEASLISAYTDLRVFGDQANIYALWEVTSDELLVPTRGTDWGDNGVWRTLHQHTWDATHPFVLTAWNQLNSNVFRINQLLAPESNASPQQIAEGRFLRAYNMFLIVDLFGQVPFRDVDEGVDVDPRALSAQQALDEFIIPDLMAALPELPEIGPGLATIHASKAAANFLLAKVYLNKHVFIGEATASDADMAAVVEAVNEIQADGFNLEDGYFEIFEADADQETIFYTDASVGNRIWNGLHYFQGTDGNPGGGWNGFSTTAEFYALFEGPDATNEPGAGQEERRGFVPGTEAIQSGDTSFIGYGFLFGQQYGPDGEPLTDRAGNPLFFTKEFPGLTGNREFHGIRVTKYHPENGAFANHLILFRYADAHLMKAEALFRSGNEGEALALVNELREIRDASALGADEFTLLSILDERGRELYIEGWRRNDQIRFGTYTAPWALKDASEDFRTLFPIPATAVASNPNLEQNPGY